MEYRVSVDTGGTFTDVVVTDSNGNFTVGKALTDKKRAFNSINKDLLWRLNSFKPQPKSFCENQRFYYGTTRATNGIVERKTAKTAFLTTSGFPDILLLKEGGKTEPHNLSIPYPEPYIPRQLTFEIPERVNAEGGIEQELDTDYTKKLVEELIQSGVEAIAVCFLWSVANQHELKVER